VPPESAGAKAALRRLLLELGSGASAPLDAALAQLARATAPYERAGELHLTCSALVVHPPSERVLLRYHRFVGGWIQLGGHGDPGEWDPLEIARREASEESGLSDLELATDSQLPSQAVLLAVAASPVEAAHRHLDLRYLLRSGHPERVKAESPDAPLRWVDLEEAARLTSEDNLVPLFAAARRLWR
jgi:8-oxo-dGTP pyrophosphatase MutT (NUDIX family)